MRIAIIGSRNIIVSDIGRYISNADEIISGGAAVVDSCVAEYARANGIKLKEFLPQYQRYGRAAPIVRNKEIVDYSDKIIALWDGSSKGTLSVIKYAKKTGSKEIMELVGHLMAVYDFGSLGGGIILGADKPIIKTRGNAEEKAIVSVTGMLLNMAQNKEVFDTEKNKI